MLNNALELLFKLFFRVLETVHEEGFVLAINLRNDVVPKMLDTVVSKQMFKHLKSVEVKLFVLFNTVVGYDFEVNVSDMVNDAASFDNKK